jgi:hypothetical protein
VRLTGPAGQSVSSGGAPLLIGRSPAAQVRLDGSAAADYHAVVWCHARWDESGQLRDVGVFVDDLHSGLGTLLNGLPVRNAQLADGDCLEVGGQALRVELLGDLEDYARMSLVPSLAAPALVLTCLSGPGVNATAPVPPAPGRLLIGSTEGCGLRLPAQAVRTEHAELLHPPATGPEDPWRPSCTIRDLTGGQATRVNDRPPPAAGEELPVVPGDVLRLGIQPNTCDLLLHYAF